ncbi:MAG: Ig-like domain-containing protein, partial [Bacteroidota bacterium]|nr:Ig-like domain-containing protein [Bacteroidota bacterium]
INLSEQQIKDLKENQSGRYLYDIQHPYSAGIPDSAATWPDWWRGSVNKFVQTLHDSIQSVKPYVRLSAAAIGAYNWSGWNGYDVVYQDAAKWFNEGWLEQLTPMHYSWDTPSGFYGMLIGDGQYSWSPYIQPGVAAKRLYTVGPGSYILDANKTWNNHPSIVNTCRTVPFVDGFQFFSYAEWRDHDYFSTAGSTFFGTKTKIRSYKDLPAPFAPFASISKIDSMNYVINVVSAPGSAGAYWYVLYQSTADNINEDSSKIIDVYYSDQPSFNIPVSYNGRQDFNGKYNYKVSQATRYWNESALSPIMTTDNIPSLPPVVTSSIPAQNDSCTLNTSITLNFSKTMDSSLTITSVPDIPQYTKIWSNGNKTVVIKPSASLIPDTIYNVTLNSNVKDINGKSIDGNGDGIGGDSYVLKFRVVPLDDVPPYVEMSYPLQNDSSFDIDGVISIQFSELVDPSSINSTTVVLKRNADLLTAKYSLTTANGKSILSLRTAPQLVPTNTYSLTLSKDIKDLYNNTMGTDYKLNFFTSKYKYSATLIIDNFNSQTGWTAPTYSGSTVGVDAAKSSFTWSSTNFVPGPSTGSAGLLTYKWDYSVTGNFLREYLSPGSQQNVTFDTTYTLQVYVYGDGLSNKLRFALDEGDGTSWPNHEVSQWYTVDWNGWKLIEWKLSDTSSVGSWIGNGKLDYAKYRLDSFQMIPGDSKDTSIGKIYFDNLRVVKRQEVVSVDQNNSQNIPSSYGLSQNYPNPFNPTTIISFSLPVSQKVTLEVFNLLGQKISTLVNSELQAGTYNINFNASNLPSGQYFY